jgi:hypothetical protein
MSGPDKSSANHRPVWVTLREAARTIVHYTMPSDRGAREIAQECNEAAFRIESSSDTGANQ